MKRRVGKHMAPSKTPKALKQIRLLLIVIVALIFIFNIKGIFAYFIDTDTIENIFTVNAQSTYTVTFNANDGTGIMQPQVITYNVGTNLTPNSFTRTGYIFMGWNTSQDGTGTEYMDEQSVTNIGDTTLYAQWHTNDFNVTFCYGDESFVGTNYINTDIPLFNTDNIHRNFEVSLSISNFQYLSGQNQNRNVFLCNQYERRRSISRNCISI